MAHSLSEKRTLLAQNILFCKLSTDDLDKLLKLSTEFTYTKGQIIFQKGDVRSLAYRSKILRGMDDEGGEPIYAQAQSLRLGRLPQKSVSL